MRKFSQLLGISALGATFHSCWLLRKLSSQSLHLLALQADV